jgi:hypothetical protein
MGHGSATSPAPNRLRRDAINLVSGEAGHKRKLKRLELLSRHVDSYEARSPGFHSFSRSRLGWGPGSCLSRSPSL